MLNTHEIKQAIEQRIPFAFTCNCNGQDEDCALVISNPYQLGRYDLAQELLQLIKTEQVLP